MPSQSSCRPRPLKLHAKASFGAWSSEMAWAEVLYIPKKDRIIFIHTWRQSVKTSSACDSDGKAPIWIKPHFSPASVKRLTDTARRMFENGYRRSSSHRNEPMPTLRGHSQTNCERCLELKHACNERSKRNAN
jgi:hypothetical protein